MCMTGLKKSNFTMSAIMNEMFVALFYVITCDETATKGNQSENFCARIELILTIIESCIHTIQKYLNK